MKIAGRSGFVTTSLMLGVGIYVVIRYGGAFLSSSFGELFRDGFWGEYGSVSFDQHKFLRHILGFFVMGIPVTVYVFLVRCISERGNRIACWIYAFLSLLIYLLPLGILTIAAADILKNILAWNLCFDVIVFGVLVMFCYVFVGKLISAMWGVFKIEGIKNQINKRWTQINKTKEGEKEMSFLRIATIVLVFMIATAGWVILGSSVYFRTGSSAKVLDGKVENLWGGKIVQMAPKFTAAVPGTGKNRPVTPSANNITGDISLKQRLKGLFWYPAYEINFKSEYTLKNTESVAQKIFVEFAFPTEADTFDNFAMALDGKPFGNMEVDTKTGVRETFEIAPGEEKKISFSYRSKGLWAWYYQPDKSTNLIRDLSLTVKTDFKMIDFPDGTLSPDSITYSENNGTELKWKAGNLITTKDIAVTMPEKINPGPLVERISFFAPVCLIFFFVMIMAMNVIRNINVHPMHYLFIAAGFFAFNLLFAYLVDVINVHLAFFISALVTVVLVNAYLKAALGATFPWKTAALGQIFYLILFSYSFFFKGVTGLTIAIGSVMTLAVLMKATVRIDWDKVFARKCEAVTED